MDATNMNFKDNSFQVTIDKGTYDALAVIFVFYDFKCAPNSSNMLRNLVVEMLRVTQ